MAAKRVDVVFNEDGRRASLTRWADLDQTKFAAGTDYVFDQLGRLTDLAHRRAGTTFANYDLAWDKAGRVTAFDFTSLVGDDGTADYAYDITNQLTGADYDFQTDEDYDYDANGNRDTGYATGDHNRLVEDGTYRYAYDEEGNRTLRFVDEDESGTLTTGDTEVTEYTWDHRNRLTSVTQYATYADYVGEDPSQVVTYAYDAFDQLVGRTLDSDGDGDVDATSVYIHQGGQIVLDFESATGSASAEDLAHRYLWGSNVDELLADEVVDDGSTADVRWALTDHLGSVRDLVVYDDNGTGTLTDDTVSVVKHVVYDAFGNVTGTTGSADCLFGYTARPYDAQTGLQNNLHRWYDAAVGRWLSEDPIGFEGDVGNLYRYCRNEPTRWIDPRGTDSGHAIPLFDDLLPLERFDVGSLPTYLPLSPDEPFSRVPGLPDPLDPDEIVPGPWPKPLSPSSDVTSEILLMTAKVNNYYIHVMMDGSIRSRGGLPGHLVPNPEGGMDFVPDDPHIYSIPEHPSSLYFGQAAGGVVLGEVLIGLRPFLPKLPKLPKPKWPWSPKTPPSAGASLPGTGSGVFPEVPGAGSLDTGVFPKVPGGGASNTPLYPKGPSKSPSFKPPTNPPQVPPTKLPDGVTVRPGLPCEQYPNGYWKLEGPPSVPGGRPQPLDPSTMKPVQPPVGPNSHTEWPDPNELFW